jgi:hypothetical protein
MQRITRAWFRGGLRSRTSASTVGTSMRPPSRRPQGRAGEACFGRVAAGYGLRDGQAIPPVSSSLLPVVGKPAFGCAVY